MADPIVLKYVVGKNELEQTAIGMETLGYELMQVLIEPMLGPHWVAIFKRIQKI